MTTTTIADRCKNCDNPNLSHTTHQLNTCWDAMQRTKVADMVTDLQTRLDVATEALRVERERCAEIAANMATERGRDADGYHAACEDIAAAIRVAP